MYESFHSIAANKDSYRYVIQMCDIKKTLKKMMWLISDYPKCAIGHSAVIGFFFQHDDIVRKKKRHLFGILIYSGGGGGCICCG